MWIRKNISTIGLIVSFIMFLIMGCLSYQSVNIKLPRYVCPETGGTSGIFGELDIGVEMKKIGQSHNTTVEKLEKSIRSEARTMTVINFISALLCISAIIAHNVDHRK